MSDAATQRSILVEALQAGIAMSEPDIVTLNYRWVEDNWKQDPLSWTRQRQNTVQSVLGDTLQLGGSGVLSGGDTRTPRSDRPTYQFEVDQDAALGSSFEQQCTVCIGLVEPAQD